MLIIGILGSINDQSNPRNMAIGALLIVFTGFYQGSVGPVCYSLVSEISSTRLRAKSVILARNTFNIAGIVINVL